MPSYPLYHDVKDENKDMNVVLTEQEQRDRENDHDEIRNAKEYRDQHKKDWIDAAWTYNVPQNPQDGRISDIYIGLGRMIIDQSVAMMTEGEPEFDFEPLSQADDKLTILWRSAVKMVLSQCNYRSHQDKFVTDLHVFGPGVFECFNEMPLRMNRVEQVDGSFSEDFVRDLRRPRIGVRHLSPFRCWRNPNVSDPDAVPSCGKEDILTWDQFASDYANCYIMTPEGKRKPKYKNIPQVMAMKSSHVKVTRQENEVRDSVRLYALPFGNDVEGKAVSIPEYELGIPIFDKALKIKKIPGAPPELRSQGLNAIGMTTLCYGANNSMYDVDCQTHSIYGMGIPRLIQGPDMAMQAFVNMNFDNMRLANTVALSYRPYDGKSYLDIDNTQFYSGMLIDGDMVATPFGQVRLSENQVMNDWLNQTCIALTGVNFLQLVGDTSKTAFEFSQRIRLNNQRAEKRIRSLENGCFKRMGMILLSNILSELTNEEWEELTMDDAKEIEAMIEAGNASAEDYKNIRGEKPERRRHMYVPVEGKFREDFTQSKKRTLDYNSTKNTLIHDPSLASDVNYVPLVREYFDPVDGISSLIRFTCKVDGKRMLGDLRAQDQQVMRLLSDYFQNRFASTAGTEQEPDVDMKKVDDQMIRFAQIEPQRIKKTSSQSKMANEVAKAIKDIEDNLFSTQLPNAQSPSPVPLAQPQVNPQGSPVAAGAAPEPPNNLQAVAAGAL